jgi:hypothetical protein
MAQYEWDIETFELVEVSHDTGIDMQIDLEEVVTDHFFFDSLKDLSQSDALLLSAHNDTRLVLVRDGIDCRSWAYVKDGVLPDVFRDAYDRPCAKVPRKFHKQFDAFKAKHDF